MGEAWGTRNIDGGAGSWAEATRANEIKGFLSIPINSPLDKLSTRMFCFLLKSNPLQNGTSSLGPNNFPGCTVLNSRCPLGCPSSYFLHPHHEVTIFLLKVTNCPFPSNSILTQSISTLRCSVLFCSVLVLRQDLEVLSVLCKLDSNSQTQMPSPLGLPSNRLQIP
jgi:hypothetical protein